MMQLRQRQSSPMKLRSICVFIVELNHDKFVKAFLVLQSTGRLRMKIAQVAPLTEAVPPKFDHIKTVLRPAAGLDVPFKIVVVEMLAMRLKQLGSDCLRQPALAAAGFTFHQQRPFEDLRQLHGLDQVGRRKIGIDAEIPTLLQSTKRIAGVWSGHNLF